MNTTRHSPARTVVLAALGLLLASSGLAVLVTTSAASADPPVHKSYVCKYVKKPGAFELLQTGQNPIWVDNHSMLGHDGPVSVGDQFSDGQILSVVIVANTLKLDPEPGTGACPSLAPPPPTQVTATAPGFRNPTCPAPAASVQLPTVEGVIYQQSGSVTPGGTVTVTAVAQTGYALVGQSAWQHQFAAVPANCTQVSPPENPPANPPAKNPPAKAPVQAPPAVAAPVVVTPSVIRAGVTAEVPAPVSPNGKPIGISLLSAGLFLLLGAGARGLGRKRVGH